jgi:hypothetical protein
MVSWSRATERRKFLVQQKVRRYDRAKKGRRGRLMQARRVLVEHFESERARLHERV